MLNDLVQVRTKDGIVLHGAWFEPQADASRGAIDVDLAICIHGTGGNFYSSTLFDALTSNLQERGVSVLRINTRGHDGISTASSASGGIRLGAAYEVIDDCRRDVTAWVLYGERRGAQKIALIGHSMGAVKAVYAAAVAPQPTVTRVIGISPPRLSYRWFQQGPTATVFGRTLKEASDLVAQGQGKQLLEVEFPLPMMITAAGYLEKYGPQEKYNFLNHLSKINCPMLFTFGTLEMERNWAFRDLPEAVREHTGPAQLIDIRTLAGADHFYTNMHSELSATITDWLDPTV